MSNPAGNDFLRFGVAVEAMNPPAIPGGGDNGDGDNYGIGGIEVTIVLYNSVTGTTETLTGEIIDDGIDNDHSEATLFGTPVEVPIPVILAAGETFTLGVQLDALAEGQYTGSWSLLNNDPDEAPFDFPLTGIVDDTAPTIAGLPGNITVSSVGTTCSAPVSWTPPTVSDNLDPAPSITQTMGPAPGASFPAGMTVVEYTVTDCSGNTDAQMFIVSVLDTTPPTLVGSLPKQIILSVPAGAGGGVVTFPPLSAFDDCDPAPVVSCVPGSGDLFPVGLTVVTCKAIDSSGNESAPATLNVIVIEARPSPANPPLDIIALRDEPAPGTAGNFLTFRRAYINDPGDIFLESTLSGVPSTANSALFSDVGGALSPVAVKGDASPNGGTYAVFDRHAITNAGNESFQASTSAGLAHFVDDAGLVATVNVGQTAAGGGTFRQLYQPAVLPNAELFTPALLTNGVDGVTTTSDTGIWNSGAAFAREGAASPIPGATYGQIFTRVVASPSTGSSVAFAAALRGVPNSTNTAVFAGPPAALAVVAREGDPAIGTAGTFGSFAAESIGNSGAVVIRARLRNGGAIDNSNNEVLYSNRNGSLELIARENEAAPCLPGSAGVFDRFDEMYMLDDGAIIFTAYLRGAGVTNANDRSLWRSDPDGFLHPLQREGQPANNASGSILSQILEVTATPIGHVAYRGRTVPNIGDSTTLNNVGLWIQEIGGIPGGTMVLRNRDTFTVPGDTERVINSVTIEDTNNAQHGSGGYGRILNDVGDLMVRISFSGNSSGVFVIDSTPLAP